MADIIHNIGLVGIGKIARDQHIPSIFERSDFELAATASRNAKIGGIDSYTNLDDLLAARDDIDCISLCTPPAARYDDARRALLAGRHVMLEKPPGATLSEVHDLIKLAQSKGVSLFASWHSRYAASVSAARNWLQDKNIQSLKIEWKEDVRRWHPEQEWIWEAGGLGVFDPGINALSILTEIYPRGLHLTKSELLFPENRATPISVNLSFRDVNNTQLEAEFDWRHTGPQTWNISFVTDEGHALLSDGGARFVVDGEEIHNGPDREYPGLYARFSELISKQEIDVDLSPLRHVSDAFTLGDRIIVDPFNW